MTLPSTAREALGLVAGTVGLMEVGLTDVEDNLDDVVFLPDGAVVG